LLYVADQISPDSGVHPAPLPPPKPIYAEKNSDNPLIQHGSFFGGQRRVKAYGCDLRGSDILYEEDE
jgi:hypothetical protein